MPDELKSTDLEEAIAQIPPGWFWERMFRFPTGYLVSLERYNGLGVAQAQECPFLAEALIRASQRAREWDETCKYAPINPAGVVKVSDAI